MKNYIKLSLITVVSLVLLTFPCSDTSFAKSKKGGPNEEMGWCTDKSLNVGFLCRSDYDTRLENGRLVTTLSKEPSVVLSVEKTRLRLGFLSQISKSYLEDSGLYADGFGEEHVRIAGRETLYVKAYGRQNENMRLADYYLINHLELYHLSFSIEPKDQWDNYKFVVKKIAESFYFMEAKDVKH